MKKRVKAKGSKGSSKHSAVEASQLPDLVTAMMKLVERLESLERKVDSVLGRVSNLPSEMRNAVQPLQRPQPAHHTQAPQQRPDHGPSQGRGHDHDGRRERMMYKAVCADCRKNCEVPFKPTEERPVYCKECFAIRKAGHAPQDPDRRSVVFHSQKKAEHFPMPVNPRPQGMAVPSGSVTVSKSGKQKPARNGGAKSKKKR